MNRLMNKLKDGVVYDSVDPSLQILLLDMEEQGIIYRKEVNEDRFYRFCNNVDVQKNKDSYTFTVTPNRYMGVFFDYDEVFECVSEGKREPNVYCLVFELNPQEDVVEYFGVGNEIKLKVEARGYDLNNEGLLLKLPRSEEEFYKMGNVPCITIGLANGAKGKNTSSLNFEERISGKFIKGRRGICIDDKIYYNLKDVKTNSVVYSVNTNDYEYELKKVKEKRMFNR